MYELYECQKKSKGEKPASYRLYCILFKKTGYKNKKTLKNPHDTCKKCDTFKTQLKNTIEKDKLEHETAYELAYRSKEDDKKRAMENHNERVIVFDLQKCLPTPDLTTNEIYYKRQLWTFNGTIRDTTEGITYCYMWHEGISGRGSNNIASCLYKHIQDNIPNTITHLKTYSDTCSSQNRNINFSIMMLIALKKHPSLEIIDQKFLEPGHTHLECDSNHARIERAKKSSEMKISIPHDWFQFVRTRRVGNSRKIVVRHRVFARISVRVPVRAVRQRHLHAHAQIAVVHHCADFNQGRHFRIVTMGKETKWNRNNKQHNSMSISTGVKTTDKNVHDSVDGVLCAIDQLWNLSLGTLIFIEDIINDITDEVIYNIFYENKRS
ncbi:hypothetical protein LSTR_LSTR007784 [Laodelphax striatellus]|uniref:DUF4371 domain-containing protein n=1 Tax=Laodelphax striatellus TaxID=195883 RepID=A0A482WND9_LAOST|nr:hypothetical protein LSTR_LSTR007784 [Laodelphax striatellus]